MWGDRYIGLKGLTVTVFLLYKNREKLSLCETCLQSRALELTAEIINLGSKGILME